MGTKSYAAINPRRPELSLEGKVVIITGVGGMIGTALARSFALAPASAIVLIGRTEKTLKASASSIEKDVPDAKIVYHLADKSNETAIQTAMSKAHDQFGKLHILVSNAGYLAPRSPTLSANTADWWKSFETNVLGSFNSARAFIFPCRRRRCLFYQHFCGFRPQSSSFSVVKLRMLKSGRSKTRRVHPSREPRLAYC